jgi:hypothetical protein
VLPILTIAISSVAIVFNRTHNVIILRHSCQRSPLREDLPQKILLIVIRGTVGCVFTLLGYYPKHKHRP